jgi:hypothetical protein
LKKIANILVSFFSCIIIVQAQKSISGSYHVDSIVAMASTKYKKPSIIKKIFIGNNYREEWSAEVKMPVFRLRDTEMKIIELGGGQQTKSLKLEDKKGREWALRTVDKDATGAIPKFLRGTIAQKVVQEVISGAYPYAPLTVAHLARAAGITVPHPQLYYVPQDAGLGGYQEVFSGKVCFLEERDPVRKGKPETESTTDVEEEIIEANDRLIIQREVLRARLLDMLIADWDRHEDQWRWGIVDSTKAKYYYAIPRDRDQAFFMANGLIPKIGKLVAMHHINWFIDHTKGLKQLNYKSWNFDKTFLNDLDASEWLNITNEFTKKLTDQVIIEAAKKLPPEIYSLSGKEIEHKLKCRIKNMGPEVMKYYRFLSRIVQVNGSNENEIFQVSGKDHNIIVSVFRQGSKGKIDNKVYERTFREEETFKLILMGYEGDDQFIIDQSVSSKIKVRLFGDKGNDHYLIKGDKKIHIYELKNEVNSIPSKNGLKIKYY